MVPGVVASHPCARPDCPTVARYVSGAGTTAAEHRGALTSPPRHTLYSAECRTTRPFLPQDEEATHRAGKGLQVGGQGHGAQDGVGRVGEADQRGQHPAKAHAVLLRAGRGWEGRPPCAASAPTTTVGSGVRSVTSTPTTTKPATAKRNVGQQLASTSNDAPPRRRQIQIIIASRRVHARAPGTAAALVVAHREGGIQI